MCAGQPDCYRGRVSSSVSHTQQVSLRGHTGSTAGVNPAVRPHWQHLERHDGGKSRGVKTKHLNSVSLRFLYWRTFFRGSSGQVLYDQSAHSTKASSGWYCWQVCPKKKRKMKTKRRFLHVLIYFNFKCVKYHFSFLSQRCTLQQL